MMNYFEIKWDDSLDINDKWRLPPSECPQCVLAGLPDHCGCAGQPGYRFPDVDLGEFSGRLKLRRLNPNKSEWIPWDEFVQLRDTIRELTGIVDCLRPCTGFGQLAGRVLGGAKDFGGDLYFHPCVSESALESLQGAGMKLNVAPTSIRPRPPKNVLYYEILAPPTASFGVSAMTRCCPLCGSWSVGIKTIKRRVVAASLDGSQPVVRVKQWMDMVLCTEDFKSAVERLKLKGLLFIPVELVDEPLPEMPEGACAVHWPTDRVAPQVPTVEPRKARPFEAVSVPLDPQRWCLEMKARLGRIQARGGQVKYRMELAVLAERLAALERSVKPVALPGAYRKFLETGSGGIEFHYTWKPKGGDDSLSGRARLCVAEKLAADLQSCKEWATETWITEYEDDQELWLNSLPFAALANGDYLALDLRPKTDDPPVIYLSHDDTSSEIAPSFTAFLAAWEQLGYIGPELWALEPFLDEKGHLTSEGEAAEELCRLLGIEQ